MKNVSGRRPCLLEDASFADLVDSHPELSALRRKHEGLSARERYAAADWIYTQSGAADLIAAMTGRESDEPLWFGELAALATDPQYPPAMLSVGSLEYQYGRVEDAMALFLGLASLPPETADLAVIIDKAGDFLIDCEDFERARKLYEAAAAADPGEVVYPTGLAYCAGKVGRFEDAVEHARRAVSLAPEASAPWSDLGFALIEVGRLEEAQEVLQRAVALDPEGVGLARGNLAHLEALRQEAVGRD